MHSAVHLSTENIIEKLNISFSESNIFEIDGYKFVSFKNLKLKAKNIKNDDTEEFISGKSMPIFFTDKYFHMIIDRVCMMEYSKQFFPELKFEFLVSGFPIHSQIAQKIITNESNSFFSFIKNKFFNHNSFINDKNDNYGYFQDIYDLYASVPNRITYTDNINVEFEECIFFIENDEYLYNLFNHNKKIFIEYVFGDATRIWLQSDQERRWVFIGLKLLRENLANIYGKFNDNKKIYISRKDYTVKYLENSISAPSEDRVYENEEFVEKVFINNGFTSVTLEGMSFKNQYILFNSVSEIAGYSGSNLLNIALSHNKLIVHEILGGKRRHWDYQGFTHMLNHKHICLTESKIINND